MNLPEILRQRLWTLAPRGGAAICRRVAFAADGGLSSKEGLLDIRWRLQEAFLLFEDLDGRPIMAFDTIERDQSGQLTFVTATDPAQPAHAVHILCEEADTLQALSVGAGTARNLIIARAGATSLHPRWFDGGPRTWDLAISSFSDDVDLADADYLSHAKGPKWLPLYRLIRKNIEIIARYDYVCLADDDLLADAPTWNAIFATCHAHDLALAQPALTDDSFISHEITRRRPGTQVRFTNFVEVMCPVFSRAALQACLQTMGDDSKYGWGQDYIWPRVLGYPTRRVGIIDAHPVKHTRPIGHATDRQEAFSKMFALLAAYGLDAQPPLVTYGALEDDLRSVA